MILVYCVFCSFTRATDMSIINLHLLTYLPTYHDTIKKI